MGALTNPRGSSGLVKCLEEPKNPLDAGGNFVLEMIEENYEDIRRVFMSYALKKMGDFHLAEDATSYAFLNMVRYHSSYRGSLNTAYKKNSDFRSWAYAVIVNSCNRKYRGMKKKCEREVISINGNGSLDPELFVHNSSPADEAFEEEKIDSLRKTYFTFLRLYWAAFQRLKKRKREILFLSDVSGFSCERLSKITGLNKNTVKLRIYRARKEIYKIIRRFTNGC